MTSTVTPITAHKEFKAVRQSPYYAKNGFVYIRTDFGDECLLPVKVEQAIENARLKVETAPNHIEKARASQILQQIETADREARKQRGVE